MAETGKKVEVRYGAFACRVEGFDDPVEKLREVLSLLQRVIAETPALADQRHALDDAEVARIGESLSRRAGDPAMPGVIVIRSGDGDGPGDGPTVEDAEILADADRREHGDDCQRQFAADTGPADGIGPATDPRQADAGPHPSVPLYAAPAAAAAEAAFAASVAAAAIPPDESARQRLAREEPDNPATPAALVAAPAAEVAEAGFSDGLAMAARPADPDDDAGDPDLRWADEAADERMQAVRPDIDGPAGAASGGNDPGAAPSDIGPSAAGVPDGAATARREAAENARSLGAPAGGWSPWASGPGDAQGMHAPPLSAAIAGNWQDSGPGIGAAPGPAFRDPPADRDGDGDETLTVINIFAPPPPDVPPPSPPEPEPPGHISRFASPVLPPDRGEPGLAVADVQDVSDAPAAVVPDRPDTAAPDATDHATEGDWPDGADESDAGDDPGADPHGSAENRLAALITRYRSGLDRQREPEAEAALGSLPAAELAERAGAAEIDDLLAVSAAWLTLSDGRARFTRRDVMQVFETLPGDHPRTLEARIKGFGSLVRSGRIELVDEGLFSLAPRERARFRALIDQD